MIEFEPYKRGDLVCLMVGAPGPDWDAAIYLRKEGDTYVLWGAPYDYGEFSEWRTKTIWPCRESMAKGYPRTIAEAQAVRAGEKP